MLFRSLLHNALLDALLRCGLLDALLRCALLEAFLPCEFLRHWLLIGTISMRIRGLVHAPVPILAAHRAIPPLSWSLSSLPTFFEPWPLIWAYDADKVPRGSHCAWRVSSATMRRPAVQTPVELGFSGRSRQDQGQTNQLCQVFQRWSYARHLARA